MLIGMGMKRNDGLGYREGMLNGFLVDRMRMMHHREVELIPIISIPLDMIMDFDPF